MDYSAMDVKQRIFAPALLRIAARELRAACRKEGK